MLLNHHGHLFLPFSEASSTYLRTHVHTITNTQPDLRGPPSCGPRNYFPRRLRAVASVALPFVLRTIHSHQYVQLSSRLKCPSALRGRTLFHVFFFSLLFRRIENSSEIIHSPSHLPPQFSSTWLCRQFPGRPKLLDS